MPYYIDPHYITVFDILNIVIDVVYSKYANLVLKKDNHGLQLFYQNYTKHGRKLK